MKAIKISNPSGLEIFLYCTNADCELRLNRDAGSCENRASVPQFPSHTKRPHARRTVRTLREFFTQQSSVLAKAY